MTTFNVSINVSKDQAQTLAAIVSESVSLRTKKLAVGSSKWCDLMNLCEEVVASVEDALKICDISTTH